MYYSESTTEEVRRLAGEIYTERYAYLLRIAKRNAASAADAEEALQDAFTFFLADYDPAAGAPPLAWLTLVVWRLRDAAHLDRRVAALPESSHEEPTGLIERRPADPRPLPERIAERDEAHHRLAALRPDQRSAIVLRAAGYTYDEIGERRGWTYTKVNRSIYEGRIALGEGARS
jgi:DNA-directed RNA polymerase specialized sigma24 family protein